MAFEAFDWVSKIIPDVTGPIQLIVFAAASVFALARTKDKIKPQVWFGCLGLAALCVIGGFYAWINPPPPPIPPQSQVADLQLRFPGKSASDRPTMLLWHRLPQDLGIAFLRPPEKLLNGSVQFTAKLAALPGRGVKYLGTASPQVDTSELTTPTNWQVCFMRSDKQDSQSWVVRMDCSDSGTCKIANDDLGLVKECADAVKQTTMSFLPQAYAAVAEQGWVVPDLQRLQALKGTPQAPAFLEFSLTAPPNAALNDVTAVKYAIKVNGRDVWINGLPSDANSVPYEKEKGLDLRFGLENLGFAGVRGGREDVEVKLRFLANGKQVRESVAALDVVALRPQPQTPVAANDPSLGLKWAAKYVSRPADRFEVFFISTHTGESASSIKRRFDDKHETAALPSGTEQLLAVIRPPLHEDKPEWGLVAGIRAPSGLIRFTFDETTANALCRRFLEMSKRSPLVDKAPYRREVGNDGKNVNVTFCSVLAA